MDGNNPPMAFPNGYVYSREVCRSGSLFYSLNQRRQALEEMAVQHDGIVTCPRSQKTCTLQELRKVFVS